MNTYLPLWLDTFLRRHPAWMWCCVVVLSLIGCWVLIAAGNNLLVYEGF